MATRHQEGIARIFSTAVPRVLLRRRHLSLCSSIGVAICLCCTANAADTGDETLKRWLDASAIVVFGEFTSDVIGFSDELGVANYCGTFRVLRSMKSPVDMGNEFSVEVIRRDLLDEQDPLQQLVLKKGGKCILFLDEEHHTVNLWFGAQLPYRAMVDDLARVAAEK